MAKLSKSTIAARNIIATAESMGWAVSLTGPTQTTVTITTVIPTDDRDAFVKADSEYWAILSLAPMTGTGSVWGTNGAGVGGHAAMATGRFVMNKSGVSKRLISALKKELS
jgi:hypothetical protein